ncbi:hypothetical protein PIB30_092729 [Stylosanthes scabra]|uniref:Uncharacterized protein n=1 Tax=Stylosanthes scabra TaxID=79078 RepID=A0ABU6YV87_9FABA|nr:hypothetical protein [Stylosanthes scabra]
MECFITWQLEPKNSGLFDRKPILNSCLNETNELKKQLELKNSGLLIEKLILKSLLIDKTEKEQKETWKGAKPELQYQSRVLTPRRHYPRLGVAEPPSPFSLIHHPKPRRDARRVGVDEAARKMTLHQGLNA